MKAQGSGGILDIANKDPKSSEGGSPSHDTAPRRRRMTRAQRERMIVDEAVKFFADYGFEGQTRELARRLGVTQPLLFRYFKNKDELIERVYQEVYLSRWNQDWESLITDRSRPIRDRMIGFYLAYWSTVSQYEWVRLFVYSGLKGASLHRRYLQMVRERIFVPLCVEIRAHFGLPDQKPAAISEPEIEMVWGIHASIFYLGVRKQIYSLPVPEDVTLQVTDIVDSFLGGAAPIFTREAYRRQSGSES